MLPTSLGGMDVRSPVTQADIAFGVTSKKMAIQTQSVAANLKKQLENGTWDVHAGMVKMDGIKVHEDGNVTLEDLVEWNVLKEPFNDVLLQATKGFRFTLTVRQILNYERRKLATNSG